MMEEEAKECTSSCTMTTEATTLTLSPEEWTALCSKVLEAQQLARSLLGRDPKEEEEEEDDNTAASTTATTTTMEDLLEAMQTFGAMKDELAQLQRESQLTRQVLVATQCSHTCISQRLEKNMAIEEEEEEKEETKTTELEDEEVDEEASVSSDLDYSLDEDAPALLPGQRAHKEDEEKDEDGDHEDDAGDHYHQDEEDDDSSEMDVPQPEDHLDEEIMMIMPTKSKSLGVGLLGEMETCIVSWQATFEDLNEQHEAQVQACQADLERLHIRIDAMKALNPTGVEAAAAAQRARDQLEELVRIVEAFPSRAKIEALQRELEASRRAEQDSHQALARAMEELEAARQREDELLRRLDEAESFARRFAEAPAEAVAGSNKATTRRLAPARLLRFTKKKLQRLFRMDRSFRQNNHEQQSRTAASSPSSAELAFHVGAEDSAEGSSTSPSTREGVHLDFGSDSELSASSETPQVSSEPDMELYNLASSDDDLLLVFSASDNDSSVDGDEVHRVQDLDDLSFSDSMDANNRDAVMLAHTGNFSPSKMSPSTSMEEDEEESCCEMDLSKGTMTDETILSFVTEATTNSTSGTPNKRTSHYNLSKKTKSKECYVEEAESSSSSKSNSLFAMAKSFLWIQ